MSGTDRRIVRPVPGGPVMVQGPVQRRDADGTVVESDRFMVAICACRRSRIIRCATPATGAGAG